MRQLAFIILISLMSSCNHSNITELDLCNTEVFEYWKEVQLQSFAKCCSDTSNIKYVKLELGRIIELRQIAIKELFLDSTLPHGKYEISEDLSSHNLFYTFSIRNNRDYEERIKYSLMDLKYQKISTTKYNWSSICHKLKREEKYNCCQYVEGHNPVISTYSKLKVNRKGKVELIKTCIFIE